ncbi:MAG: phosphotransferase [Corynebacterium sp.]|uniref:phosphotransferase family protein n=1 Tax=Corynebacterium sp. TaxID=1720 RepID=UPI0026DB77D2|nr:phosphotransferase [Corynebacterium sp.]MDO5029142.1 phosphotransferase [Corynebacterium sp.]
MEYSDDDEKAVQQVVADAEQLLSARFGGKPNLSEPEILAGQSNALVVRVRVGSNPFMQERTAVVKQMPAASEGIDPAVLREVVAYQFLNTLPDDVRPGPQLLAYDVSRQLLVLSDVGVVDTLADVLISGDEERRLRAFRGLGASLGRMHIHTHTREEGFETLRRRLWTKNKVKGESLYARDKGIVDAIDFGIRAFEGSGIAVPDAVRSFGADAARRIEKGTHRAFTPFDLAPDNILLADKVQFLDYEWAGYRDVLFDVASVVAGFPLHVFVERPTEAEVDVFIRAWIEEIRDQWYRGTDERRLLAFIAAALVGWLFISATVVFFGSPMEALWVDHEDRSDLKPQLGGSALERRDMANTARAVAQFAQKCDDDRAVELEQFAHTVIEFLENEEE